MSTYPDAPGHRNVETSIAAADALAPKLGRLTGQPYRAHVIHSKPIGGRLGLETGNPELHAVNVDVAFGYLCKGAPQSALDAADIDRKHQPGGRVIGKRCGTSQNIGAKARKAEDLQWPIARNRTAA